MSILGFVIRQSQTASKKLMNFLREQIRLPRCLKGSLSGKGQKFLTAWIPAPGGNQ